MPTDFEKAKQEQERKRELWRGKQEARMKKYLPVDLLNNKKEQDENVEDEQESIGDESPRSVGNRLKKQKLGESKKRGKGGIKGKIGETKKKVEETKKKVEEVKKAAEGLKNIYRIINGASAATLMGLIITFLIMNAQLIFGNWLKLKIIPKLSFPEILIILFVNFIIFITLLISLLLICLIISLVLDLF